MECTVLINAGPWLPVDPKGMGGLENVIAELIPRLRRQGVRVVLATVASSTVEVDEKIWIYKSAQYSNMPKRYTAVCGIPHAHMQCVINRLQQGGIDLVHDHLEVVGPSILSVLGEFAPPVLHTLHFPLNKFPSFYKSFDSKNKVYFNGVSESQVVHAPLNLRRRMSGTIPIGIDLSVYALKARKADYFLCLSRICSDKGQDIAARICQRQGHKLVLAGPIDGIATPTQFQLEVNNEKGVTRTLPAVQFYLDKVVPHLDEHRVRWIGSVTGSDKLDLLGHARALLMPVRWEEPGAVVASEALACGTPIIALRRGVFPSIVEHGVNGFLADNEQEFAQYLDRIDEIDPAVCRQIAERRFSADAMASSYVKLYEQIIDQTLLPKALFWNGQTRAKVTQKKVSEAMV